MTYNGIEDEISISIHKALAGLDHNPHGPPMVPVSISIHKALAGLDIYGAGTAKKLFISIHKALAGLDLGSPARLRKVPVFQSTRPSRASTQVNSERYIYDRISIHKALAGLDEHIPYLG